MSERSTPGVRAQPIDAACLLLSAAGGFADAGSYIMSGSFTGHVTGNALLTAVYLTQGNLALAFSSVLAVAAFMSGTAAGTAWKQQGNTSSRCLAMTLAVEILLIATGLALFNVGGLLGKTWLLATVCFSLGLQNGTLGRLGSVSIHSTYITGMSTSLVIAIMNQKKLERSVFMKVIGCFLAGAAVGAFMTDRFGETGYAFIIMLLSGAFGLTFLPQRCAGMSDIID